MRGPSAMLLTLVLTTLAAAQSEDGPESAVDNPYLQRLVED